MASRSLDGPAVRVVTVAVFVLACVATAVWFFASMGGRFPGVAADGYQVDFRTHDVDNLIPDAEVRIAGVLVGRVVERELEDGAARLRLEIAPEHAPLHEGVTVRIGLKSLVGASYVDVVDGTGPELPGHAMLPDSAVVPSVEVDDVIAALPPETRTALSTAVQSLGTATAGRQPEIEQLMAGLGDVAEGSRTALDAIAAQSADLEALTREATRLLDTLDTGQGQIATVVEQAQRLTRATSGQREALEATVRALPAVLDSAESATHDVTTLSAALAPVAADLNGAAPPLNEALVLLPDVTTDLRGLLPALDEVLDEAPNTLERTPTLRDDVALLTPQLRTLLADANPLLGYLAPYGRDTGAMLASFGASFETRSENGLHVARLAPIVNSSSFRGYPLETQELDPTHWTNPYPKAGEAGAPKPFEGEYPRVERAPR